MVEQDVQPTEKTKRIAFQAMVEQDVQPTDKTI